MGKLPPPSRFLETTENRKAEAKAEDLGFEWFDSLNV